MRRSVPVLACVLLLLGSGFLPALSRADLDRVVDFLGHPEDTCRCRRRQGAASRRTGSSC